jgi:hypothetical protein
MTDNARKTGAAVEAAHANVAYSPLSIFGATILNA